MALVRLVRRLLGRKEDPLFPLDLDSDDDRRTRTSIVAVIWAAVIVVGVPVWWKTTEVYRAHLPFGDMQAWTEPGSTDYVIPISLALHVPRGALDERELDRLPAIVAEACDAVARRRAAELDGFELRTQDARKVDVLPPRIGFAFSAQAVDDLESGDVDLPEADLDAALARRFSNTSEGSNGKYHIALIPSLDGDSKWRVYAGTRRTLLTYLPRTLPGPHLDVFSDAAVSVVTGIFLSELYHLRKSVSDETAREKDVLRTAKYARSYVATFSLLNAAPDEVLVSWQIQDAIEAYLSPLLHSVSPITNVTVTSQILPFSTLPMRPLKSTGLADHPFYFFRAEHLPHFINTAEWNLASTGTGSPLHFLLYIPKQNEYPLYILDSAKERVETNAWLVPGWGGAHVSNLPLEAAVQGNGTTMVASTFTFTREILRPIMGIFAAQLRGLLGVQAEIIEADPVARPATGLAPLPLVYAAPDPSRGLTDMEFDRLSRKRCARNVLDAARGLASLGKLVSGLPSMVVPDRIRVAVDGSLARLRDAIELSEKGDLDAAFAASADALELSEAAFFDPAAVSMLYFPDEHRYAVYMPFFVPVGVPLVVGLVAEIRRWRDRRRHAKEKGE